MGVEGFDEGAQAAQHSTRAAAAGSEVAPAGRKGLADIGVAPAGRSAGTARRPPGPCSSGGLRAVDMESR